MMKRQYAQIISTHRIKSRSQPTLLAKIGGVFGLMLVTYSAYADSFNVPDLKSQQLVPTYWQSLLMEKKSVKGDQLMMSSKQIEQYNQQLFASNEHMLKPLDMAEKITKAKLLERMDSISAVPSSARFYRDGRALQKDDYQNYLFNLNKQGIKAVNSVRFGLVVKRSVLRTFPTLDRVFNEQMDLDLDRFQESGVFPGEAVAILHTSSDHQWVLVQNYHYLAWMPAEDLAIGDKLQIQQFIDEKSRLVITGSKVMTSFVPDEPLISQVQLDMGVSLPLIAAEPSNIEVYGQSSAGSYMVNLPVRKDNGELAFKTALIGKSQDVHLGYLAFTQENIINQAFKFLGERYGWGHDYNGRDCTGFVGEIYKTFGILMPRNSGQQGKGEYGINVRFDQRSDLAAKLAVIRQLQVGDLIYIPGHVMMFLGTDQGQPFVIHDVKGLAYWTATGEFYTGTLNAVSVTPLIPLSLNQSTTYVDRIYTIKRIAPIPLTTGSL
jgi:cell wall-associated NlpC family hydrolase